MKITLCGSISFAGEILRIRDELVKMGHEALLPASIIDFSIENSEGAARLKSDRERYLNEIKPHYTKEHFELVEQGDAILVVNCDKHGVKNYIGGATFSEIMLAYNLGKKIFFLNPIPRDERLAVFIDELETVKPIVLDGDLEKLQMV